MTDISQSDVVKTLRDAPWVMVTTARRDQKLIAHPMVPQEVTDDADAWFFVSLSGGQADALQQGPEVNIAVSSAGT